MNWNKLTLLGGVALAIAAIPAAQAQRAGRGGGSRTSVAAPGSRSFAAHVPGRSAGRGNFHNSTNHWGNHRWHRHRGFYPYYDFYPLGYPFWGTSASLYYNDYYPRYVGTAGTGGSVTAEVQLQLAEAGYYHGAIDGIAGNGTRSAIRAYERAHGLPVDARLLARMGLD